MIITNKETNKPIVVAVGLFVHGFSFTRVFESLFEHLSSFYNIHWLGIAYKGDIQQKENYTLHPCNLHGGDIYGAYGAAELALQLQAKSVLLLNDFYMLKNYEQAFRPLKEKNIKTVAYVPIDGYLIDIAIASECLFLDDIVLYSQWAMQEVQQAIEAVRKENDPSPRLHYIYHGVDVSSFISADTEEIKKLKQQLFPVPDAGNIILILNANRYNERKDLETTIIAFEKAVDQFQQPAYLCLHTPNIQSPLREKLQQLVENSSCKEKILLNPLGEEFIDDKKLLQLYQACAIGVNTSLGEGWGMISFEHAACGAAQVVPDHTVPSEIWKGVALQIPKAKPVQLTTNPFLMYEVDAGTMAKQLIQLVNDEKLLANVSAKCLKHVNEENFSWKKIATQWSQLL